MIGGLAGIGILFSYLSAAWQGNLSSNDLFGSGYAETLGTFGITAIVGILLFPRTIGMAFTPMSFATPFAFLIALVRVGFEHAIFIAICGLAAWLITFVIGVLRPEST